MQKLHNQKRVRFIEKLLIAWALVATLAYFVQKASNEYTFEYDAMNAPLYEKRFAALLQVLPPGEKITVLLDPPGAVAQPLQDQRARYASYLLTPYLGKGKYFATNYHLETDIEQVAASRNLDLVKDFGNGVALLRLKGSL